jgi:hypothetical protein
MSTYSLLNVFSNWFRTKKALGNFLSGDPSLYLDWEVSKILELTVAKSDQEPIHGPNWPLICVL